MQYLKTLVLAAALTLGLGGAALADVVESTETDDTLDAVDEVTGVLYANKEQVLTIFADTALGAGTSVTAWLQRGVAGGELAWENVLRIADGSTAVSDVTLTYTNGANRAPYRVAVTAQSGSDDLHVSLTNGEVKPQYTLFDGVDFIGSFDEFYLDTALLTEAVSATSGHWVVGEDDSTGTEGIITDTLHEGGITQVSGTGADLNDTACLSYTNITDQFSLVSTGWTAMEVRHQVDNVNGQIGMALTDAACAATGLEPVDADSDVVTLITYTDSVGFVFQEEMTDTDGVTPFSYNTSVEGHDIEGNGTGNEFIVQTLAAATYVNHRVEVDSTGDCYFYAGTTRANMALVYAENQCVATAANLIPFIWANGPTASTSQQIDYVEFKFARPSS